MPEPERYDVVVIGSGEGGKFLAWHMAQAGQRTAVVERRWLGGSCPNINCLPSKNEIWSAGVAKIVAPESSASRPARSRSTSRRYCSASETCSIASSLFTWSVIKRAALSSSWGARVSSRRRRSRWP